MKKGSAFVSMRYFLCYQNTVLTYYILCVFPSLSMARNIFFRTKIKTVNWIFTKTGKNSSQGGKEIPEQTTSIDLMLKGIYTVNSLKVKLLTPKYHCFFIERTTVQECHFPLSYWVEFKVYASENLAS